MNNTYSAARIHAMKSRLIPRGEYERILKMGEREVLAFLLSTDYREDIESLQVRDLSDLELFDRVIAHNTARELVKLQRIASPQYATTLAMFLQQNDIWNLLVVADAIASRTDPRETLKEYGRTGTFDAREYCAAKTLPELAAIASKPYPALRTAPSGIAAFKDAVRQSESPPGGEAHARQYLIDEKNILLLLRLKRENLPAALINARLRRGGSLSMATLRIAANAPDFAGALAALRLTPYGAIAGIGQSTVVQLEGELHRIVLRRIGRQKHPIRPQLLLQYLSQKEIERANLRMIIKGKQLGLDEAFLREHMVA
jgi:V/A-type H+/Na+-transporting ATPase subunit C